MGTSLLIWLHLLAAICWIGGTIFLSLVLVPVLKCEPFTAQRPLLFRTVALRFRRVVWCAIAGLLLTGPLLLHQRGLSLSDPSNWPTVLTVKLGLVTFLLFLTLTHDLVLGPLVGKISQRPVESRTKFEQALVLWFPLVARFSLVLTLAVLFAAVLLVRS